ncbi:hypothetical protein BOTBODRAFT_181020 [Botryobasidium botryosum FD-172 SS1]|uniref:PCI domain-containing protein n=1 Tax=Botryobasidium botryosum (strain FD-172 SS1) TaxID=930990 RepID=A0A067M632_BOTB1|nr:hypothetical protein BOTBODRAFT_181020 [Botryobasidium botryosum FD-172 SS1]
MADDIVLPVPNLAIPQHHFIITNAKFADTHASAKQALLAAIEADEMAPYYRLLLAQSPGLLPSSSSALDAMEAANKAELDKLDARLQEAEKTEGETEISDALRARASYLTRIGDKDSAVEAQKLALSKTPGLGARIDIVLTLVRIGFFFNDNSLVSQNLQKAEELIESGGDWDRLNRLKVYRALSLLSTRQFERAGELLIDALSTFTATELLGYNDFVRLVVIVNTLVLKRVDLKKKVLSSPEVIQVQGEVPELLDLTTSLYNCNYAKFFLALGSLEQSHLLPSRLLSPHARYYVREMRIIAYAQILESYRSLTLQSLATAFGVGIDFVDKDLSHFISSGRLNCTIDKVQGIIETNRPSHKNAQYETVVRQGDLLLNNVQRLSKILY